MPLFPENPTLVDAEWLTETLRQHGTLSETERVSSVTLLPIGEVVGVVGRSYVFP